MFFLYYYAASVFVISAAAAAAAEEAAFVVGVRSSAAVATSHHQPTCLHSSKDDDRDEGESFQLTTGGDCDDRNNKVIIRRRNFLDAALLTGFACASSALSNRAHAGAKIDINQTRFSSGNFFDCLLDLPPMTQGCIRLYLCRHGETESNRLKIIRGTNSVDEPINSLGIEQAERLGIAVARLKDSPSHNAPALVTYSEFLRAKETAEVLTSTANSLLKQQQQQQQQKSPIQLYGVISSLGKVDFGSGVDGEGFKVAKSKMMSTIASWARGDIDQRTDDGQGESGREGKRNYLMNPSSCNFFLST
jgi:broad specificity phosphatase PhoE